MSLWRRKRPRKSYRHLLGGIGWTSEGRKDQQVGRIGRCSAGVEERTFASTWMAKRWGRRLARISKGRGLRPEDL